MRLNGTFHSIEWDLKLDLAGFDEIQLDLMGIEGNFVKCMVPVCARCVSEHGSTPNYDMFFS